MSFAFFLALLFFAPLAFGTTETWSMAATELSAALTALFYFYPFFFKKIVFYKTPGLVPLLLLLCWIYIQCIPLPMPLVQLISPNTAAIYRPVLALHQAEIWIPLTVNRQATLLEGLRLSSYAFFYLLTVQILSRSRRLVITLHAVTGLAVLIALLSVLQRLTAPDTLFWLRENPYGSFGPWVNRNQYAGFMVMACPLVLALSFLHRSAVDHDASCRERLVALFSGAGASLYLLFGFGAFFILSSVLLAESRGGILSIVCALLLFFALLTYKQGKIQCLTPLFLCTCLVFTAGWFSWEPVIQRFSSMLDTATGSIRDDRLLIWQDTFKIIADYPLTGSGFGTFLDVFPTYKTFIDQLTYDHAHNDYLELLTDGGLIGFVLAGWFMGTVLVTGFRQILKRRDRLAVLPAIGAFSGITGLLVYSASDFNLHNGANGLYFFFLCGLLISAGHTRRHYRHRPTLLTPGAAIWTAGFLAASVLLLLAVVRLQGGLILADIRYKQARMVSASNWKPEEKLAKMIDLLEQARRDNPFSGVYPHALGNIRKYQQQDDQASQLYKEAALRQPMQSAFLQAAGLLLAKTDVKKARSLLESGYRRAEQKDEPLKIWLEFELNLHNRAEGIRIAHDALRYNPNLLKAVYPLVTRYRFTRDEITAILPESASAWIAYWNIARSESGGNDAKYFLTHALSFLERKKEVHPHYFMQVYTYYRQQKLEDKAAEVLRQGIGWLPEYAPFHIHLGDYYTKKNNVRQAGEEYQRALRLDPGNAGIKKRISQLK